MVLRSHFLPTMLKSIFMISYLRNVLFSNLQLERVPDKVLEGALFGRIAQTSGLSANPKTLVCEFAERLEATH